LVLETTDSVGLPDLSIVEEAEGSTTASRPPCRDEEGCCMDAESLLSRAAAGPRPSEDADALIVASLRRRSSNGAPPVP
jgi:hypothetical protein